jgi:hypothetical protein
MLDLLGRYCVNIDDMNAEVEPLPLVPATWIGFRMSKSDGWKDVRGDAKYS